MKSLNLHQINYTDNCNYGKLILNLNLNLNMNFSKKTRLMYIIDPIFCQNTFLLSKLIEKATSPMNSKNASWYILWNDAENKIIGYIYSNYFTIENTIKDIIFELDKKGKLKFIPNYDDFDNHYIMYKANTLFRNECLFLKLKECATANSSDECIFIILWDDHKKNKIGLIKSNPVLIELCHKLFMNKFNNTYRKSSDKLITDKIEKKKKINNIYSRSQDIYFTRAGLQKLNIFAVQIKKKVEEYNKLKKFI